GGALDPGARDQPRGARLAGRGGREAAREGPGGAVPVGGRGGGVARPAPGPGPAPVGGAAARGHAIGGATARTGPTRAPEAVGRRGRGPRAARSDTFCASPGRSACGAADPETDRV